MKNIEDVYDEIKKLGGFTKLVRKVFYMALRHHVALIFVILFASYQVIVLIDRALSEKAVVAKTYGKRP